MILNWSILKEKGEKNKKRIRDFKYLISDLKSKIKVPKSIEMKQDFYNMLTIYNEIFKMLNNPINNQLWDYNEIPIVINDKIKSDYIFIYEES